MPRTDEPDFLDEIIAASEEGHPGFSASVDDAYRRRVMGRALADLRRALGLSQTEVASRMGTSQPAVSRLENGGDVRLSTLTRYMGVVGLPPDWPERFVAAK